MLSPCHSPKHHLVLYHVPLHLRARLCHPDQYLIQDQSLTNTSLFYLKWTRKSPLQLISDLWKSRNGTGATSAGGCGQWWVLLWFNRPCGSGVVVMLTLMVIITVGVVIGSVQWAVSPSGCGHYHHRRCTVRGTIATHKLMLGNCCFDIHHIALWYKTHVGVVIATVGVVTLLLTLQVLSFQGHIKQSGFGLTTCKLHPP